MKQGIVKIWLLLMLCWLPRGVNSGQVEYIFDDVATLNYQIFSFLILLVFGLSLGILFLVYHRTRMTKSFERSQLKIEKQQLQIEHLSSQLKTVNYSVAHDLRTPITHVKNSLFLLKNRSKFTLTDKQIDYLTAMEFSVEKIEVMLDKLGELAKIEHIIPQHNSLDLNILVKDIWNEFQMINYHDCQRYEIVIADLMTIQSDEFLLRQLITNLLSNAIKFSSEGRLPKIIVTGKREENSFLLSIHDNGIGFHQKHNDEIFEPFRRLNAQKQVEGSGLGLAIVAQIVKKISGSILVESTADVGTTFFVQIPISVPVRTTNHLDTF